MNLRWIGATGAAVSCLLLAGCSGMAANPQASTGLDGTSRVFAELPGQAMPHAFG